MRPRMGASARSAGRIRLQIVADSAAAGGKPRGRNDAPQRGAGPRERVDALYFPVNFVLQAAEPLPRSPPGRRSAAFRCKEQCKYNGSTGATARQAAVRSPYDFELAWKNLMTQPRAVQHKA